MGHKPVTASICCLLLFAFVWTALAQDDTIVREDIKYEIYGLICSRDGGNYACCAKDGDKKFVITGDKEGKKYNNVMAPVFSADGRTVAYKAIEGAKYLIVQGAQEHVKFDDAGNPVFAPKGSSIAYCAVFKIPPPPYEKRPLWCMVENNMWTATGAERIGDIVYNAEGTSLAYAFADRADWVLVSGLCSQVKYDSVTNPVFSPDGKNIAYRAEKDQKKFIVLGDTEKTKYGDVGRPVFSPDGKILAYRANPDKRWSEGGKPFIVVNEQEGRQYDEVGDPVFSPDGRTIAYCAKKDGRWFIASENSDVKQRAGALEKKEEKLVGAGYAFAKDPVFCPDGKTIAYRVENGKRKSIVVGEEQGGEYFEISNIAFADSGTVCYYAYDGKNIYKVKHKIKK